MTPAVDLEALLSNLDDRVKTELASTPTVKDVGHDLDVDDLPITARRWLKVTDVVAVVADLKNSTKLGTGKWAASTASIYEAATGGVVSVFDEFAADFLAIQGDGVFALFWGDNRVQRAVCAGITVKTFSEDLIARLENKWDNITDIGTGYKVGVANSRILVKRVGTPRNPAQQEPVWAGNAVNYATKAAQCADRGQMVVTGPIWDSIESNDYLALSCPCDEGPSESIWEDFTIDRLPEGDPDAVGRVLSATWCDVHGADYCTAVLAGKKKRDDASEARLALTKSRMENAWWVKAQHERRARLARVRGLAS
jgi:class 3 adenylate cyclase